MVVLANLPRVLSFFFGISLDENAKGTCNFVTGLHSTKATIDESPLVVIVADDDASFILHVFTEMIR